MVWSMGWMALWSLVWSFAGFLGGALFGLIHAIGTVTFQVDHIVSGVAINILAAGVARFFLLLLMQTFLQEEQHNHQELMRE